MEEEDWVSEADNLTLRGESDLVIKPKRETGEINLAGELEGRERTAK